MQIYVEHWGGWFSKIYHFLSFFEIERDDLTHLRRCPIFCPKWSEVKKKGHHFPRWLISCPKWSVDQNKRVITFADVEHENIGGTLPEYCRGCIPPFPLDFHLCYCITIKFLIFNFTKMLYSKILLVETFGMMQYVPTSIPLSKMKKCDAYKSIIISANNGWEVSILLPPISRYYAKSLFYLKKNPI